ncbi:hypothetical protein ALC60_04839 [Trachymyrmex zeteki]|uniref:Uncharacterized protein n=1 Tax=Mycetomoellerius zeteki TaxID=64791 RepID=A0A151X777_9HYME|nr:hypothetical protein ALC60_04839 [Trachymyrmex zeteki]
MDLRSRENSSVNSFFHFVSISCLTIIAPARRSKPLFGTPNGLIFSARTIKAVSVASPTFSNACLNSIVAHDADCTDLVQCFIILSSNFLTSQEDLTDGFISRAGDFEFMEAAIITLNLVKDEHSINVKIFKKL